MAKDTGVHSPFRRPAFLVSAGFLAAVIVMAAIVIGFGFGGRDEPATNHAQPSPPTTSTTPAQADARCRPTDTNQQIPNRAPDRITWSLYHHAAVPSSATAGPLIIDGDVARCYARTPRGALMAGTQIMIRQFGAMNWRAVVEQQIAPGPGRDAFVRLRTTQPPVAPDSGSPGTRGQIAGFKFVTYTPDVAVIQVALQFSNIGRMKTAALTVVWKDGDWKLQLQPDGAPSATQQEIHSLDGFVPWGGV